MNQQMKSFDSKAIKHLQIRKITDQIEYKQTQILLNDTKIDVELDGGADVNVIDEVYLRKFNRRQPFTKKITLKPTKIKLKALMNSLPVKGEFQATIANKTKRIVTKFIVIKGNMNSYLLIGRKSLLELGMLIIDPEGRLGEYKQVKT
jgi:hypothetical protein